MLTKIIIGLFCFLVGVIFSDESPAAQLVIWIAGVVLVACVGAKIALML